MKLWYSTYTRWSLLFLGLKQSWGRGHEVGHQPQKVLLRSAQQDHHDLELQWWQETATATV